MTSLRDMRVTAPNTPVGDGLVEAALGQANLTCIKLMSANLDVRRLPELYPLLRPKIDAIYSLQMGLSNHAFMRPADGNTGGHQAGPALCGFPQPLEEGRWDSELACSVLSEMQGLRELVLLQWPPWQWRDALDVLFSVTPLLTKLDLYMPFPDLPHLQNLRQLQHLRLTVGGGGGKGWLVQAATRGGQRGRRRRAPPTLPPAELGESLPRVPHEVRFGNISDWPFAGQLVTLHLQLANGFMTKAAVRASLAPDSPRKPDRNNDWNNLDDPDSPRNDAAENDQPTLGYRVASQLSLLTRLSELHLSGLPKYNHTTRAPSGDFSFALCASLASMPQLQHLVIGPQCLPQQLNAGLLQAENLTHLELAIQHSVDPSLPVLAKLHNLVVRTKTAQDSVSLDTGPLHA